MIQQKIGQQIILLPCSALVGSSLDRWSQCEAMLFAKDERNVENVTWDLTSGI